MEFNLFIIPITFIAVELLKPFASDKYLPAVAVLIGLLAGIGYGYYYGQDLFSHAVQGLVYGASASGIYDLAKSVRE